MQRLQVVQLPVARLDVDSELLELVCDQLKRF
jgi:hypothetical protein